MSSLTFVALCGMMIGANESESYAEAHQSAMKGGERIKIPQF